MQLTYAEAPRVQGQPSCFAAASPIGSLARPVCPGDVSAVIRPRTTVPRLFILTALSGIVDPEAASAVLPWPRPAHAPAGPHRLMWGLPTSTVDGPLQSLCLLRNSFALGLLLASGGWRFPVRNALPSASWNSFRLPLSCCGPYWSNMLASRQETIATQWRNRHSANRPTVAHYPVATFSVRVSCHD